MTPEDLIQRARAQPIVTVDRVVSVPGAELAAQLAEHRGMRLTEYLAHPDLHRENGSLRFGHLLGPGLLPRSIEDWQAAHPRHLLPQDLIRMLTLFDGVHLWADLADGRSYKGLHPLAEWRDAVDSFSALFRSPPDGTLAISYGANGDYVLFLDTRVPEYRWHDLEDFDHSRFIGCSVEQLLDFLWQEATADDPRKAPDVPTPPRRPVDLKEAIQAGDRDAVEQFLSRGALAAGYVHQAVYRGDAAILQSILEAGGSPDERGGIGGSETPLFVAARAGRADLAAVLIDRGADVSHRCSAEGTALEMAVPYPEVVAVLAKAGAEPTTTRLREMLQRLRQTD